MRPPRYRPLVVAHRGASHDHPEHTEAAYRAAFAAGADAVECDVRLTADQQLVCVHDATVERTSSGRGRVSSMTLAELADLDWGSWKAGAGPARLLTLGRLLDLVAESAEQGRPVGLAIETKHPSRFGGQIEERLGELLLDRGLAGAGAPVRVMSFSRTALRRLQRLTPQLDLVQLFDRIPLTLATGLLPPGVAAAGISVRLLRDRPDVVGTLRRAGHAVHVWTVDDPEDVWRCLQERVDAIITNRPREVLDQLGE